MISNKDNKYLNTLISNIFYELHNSNINSILKYNKLNFKNKMGCSEFQLECENIGIKLNEINKNKLKEYKNKKFIAYIYIDYEKQFCVIENKKDHYEISLKNTKYKIYSHEIINLEIIKIWDYEKTNFNNLFIEHKKDITKIKIEYIILIFLFNSLLFFLMIIGNMYLKIIIQDIIPNHAIYNFIFISIFFLIIFTINILIESFLNIYKTKMSYKLTYNYINFFVNDLLNKDSEYIAKNSREDILLNLKSIFPVIEKQIFSLPDFISSLFILFCTTIIMGVISYYFLLISLVSFLFNLLIYILKINQVKKMKNNINIKETKFDNHIYEYISEIKNSWYNENFNDHKNEVINSLINFQNILYENLIVKEKNNLFEKIGNKIIFIFFSIISVFFIINNTYNYFSVATMIYAFTLMNIINNNAENTFSFLSNLSFYKIHEEKINEYKRNKINNNNKLYIEENIKKISIKNLDVKINNKYLIKNLSKEIKNDTLIMGKNGIGKTTILKSMLPNNLSKNIFLNNVSVNLYDYKSLKNKIIYINSKTYFNNIDINKIIHYDINKTNKIINFLKKNNLFDSINSKNKSLGEYQIFNFLNIVHESNKIILLDESLSNVSTEVKKDIIKNFKNDLVKKNFVIWVSHDKKIKKFFKNYWEVKNV